MLNNYIGPKLTVEEGLDEEYMHIDYADKSWFSG
jgi:hypothetical protein